MTLLTLNSPQLYQQPDLPSTCQWSTTNTIPLVLVPPQLSSPSSLTVYDFATYFTKNAREHLPQPSPLMALPASAFSPLKMFTHLLHLTVSTPVPLTWPDISHDIFPFLKTPINSFLFSGLIPTPALYRTSQNIWQTSPLGQLHITSSSTLSKTEPLFVLEKDCPHMDLSVTVEDVTVLPSSTVRNLGVIIDNATSAERLVRPSLKANKGCSVKSGLISVLDDPVVERTPDQCQESRVTHHLPQKTQDSLGQTLPQSLIAWHPLSVLTET